MIVGLKIRVLSVLIYGCLFLFMAEMPAFSSSDPKRILSLIDYIGSDYQNAVENGAVINHNEYNEMLEFSSEAEHLFGRLLGSREDKADIGSDIIRLSALITDRSSVKEVKRLSKSIKEKIVVSYGINPYPEKPPSRAAGKELYSSYCSQCHGVKGAGDGLLAMGLSPRPTNFLDPDFYAGLSPFKAHNAMTFGLKGTAMPSFPALSDIDKWDVAFYLSSLAADEDGNNKGGNLASDLPEEVKDYKILATLTNDEVKDRIGEHIGDKREREYVFAYLRSGDYQSLDSPLVMANQLLDDSLKLYRSGSSREAHEKALDAYLLGFEQVESDLFVRDKGLASQIESKLSQLREAIKSEIPIEEVTALRDDIGKDLESASDVLAGEQPVDAYMSFLNSFAIILREGLEAILVIAAIIAFLNATGARAYVRYIHFGWILAIVVGLLTWVLARTIISISGAQREVIEGLTALTAACVLFYVSYWLITKIEVRKWKEYIEGKVKRALTKKNLLALASVSFFAVYREAFETVLFYQALWFQSENSKSAVVWGFIAGLALLVVLFIVVFKMALRIPIRYFFSFTSIFLYLLSFTLLGKGIRELQEAGVVSETSAGFLPRLEALGIYPTFETAAPQALMILAFAFALFWLGYVRRERDKREIAVSVSQIGDDMKSIYEAFDHIKGHIISWRRCKDIDLEAEDLDKRIQEVMGHVDGLENKLTDFYDDVVSKSGEPSKAYLTKL